MGHVTRRCIVDQSGTINGMWLLDPEQAKDIGIFSTLIAGDVTRDQLFRVVAGDYRIVPNTVNDDGGCFVMFGDLPAPGETIEVEDERGEPGKMTFDVEICKESDGQAKSRTQSKSNSTERRTNLNWAVVVLIGVALCLATWAALKLL